MLRDAYEFKRVCIALHYQNAITTIRNDVIQMFNDFSRIDENEFEFIDHTSRELCIVELIVEQIHATCFDDIYTMHVHQSRTNKNQFIVDCAFELNTNVYLHDDEFTKFELIHNYDIRVMIDISNEKFDHYEICNTIEFVECELIYRNAYTSRDYESCI